MATTRPPPPVPPEEERVEYGPYPPHIPLGVPEGNALLERLTQDEPISEDYLPDTPTDDTTPSDVVPSPLSAASEEPRYNLRPRQGGRAVLPRLQTTSRAFPARIQISLREG